MLVWELLPFQEVLKERESRGLQRQADRSRGGVDGGAEGGRPSRIIGMHEHLKFVHWDDSRLGEWSKGRVQSLVCAIEGAMEIVVGDAADLWRRSWPRRRARRRASSMIM